MISRRPETKKWFDFCINKYMTENMNQTGRNYSLPGGSTLSPTTAIRLFKSMSLEGNAITHERFFMQLLTHFQVVVNSFSEVWTSNKGRWSTWLKTNGFSVNDDNIVSVPTPSTAGE